MNPLPSGNDSLPSGQNPLASVIAADDFESCGREMYQLIERLYPICRSITGDGLRRTLRMITEIIPVRIHEVPTGTEVFDWVIPNEWNIRDAFVKNSAGHRVIDFKKSNLHVVNYSVPVSAKMSLDELRPHLHTLPEHPEWIPYRTTYYDEAWGFCLAHKELESLPDDEYEVLIDATLEAGSLTYGDLLIRGETEERILLFAHVCHPSLCNDNLSGVALLAELAKILSAVPLRYTYQIVFALATIGSIAWLSRNEADISKIRHGLVVSVVGDAGKMHYKRSRAHTAVIDRAVLHVLEHFGKSFEVLDFSPLGYDERQFSSPGINLPVGRLTRSPNGAFPEYHTSADDLSLVKEAWLTDSLKTYLNVLCCLESNFTYRNQYPKGEPQLGRRGLYRKMGGFQDISTTQLAMLWLLNLSDGSNDLLDIAEQSGISYLQLDATARLLTEHGLLARAKN